MFNTIKIENIKGLKSCILRDLGRINVVCGKNNSGKSTLLEGINNDENRQIILESNLENVDYIYSNTNEYCNWRENPDSNELYKNIIESTLKERQIWLSNDTKDFSNLLNKNVLESHKLGKHAYSKQIAMAAYDNFFKKEHSIILIPAKRKLELSKNVNVTEQINEEGTGILDYLFLSKNKQYDSIEKKIYNKICEAFYKISSGYEFDIYFEKHSQYPNFIILRFSNNKQSWINAEDCGLGLQDLLIILYFTFSSQYEVILIEEPENHIHPDMQRKLLIYLKNNMIDKQFFLTTHSNIFLNNSLVDKIFFTHFEDTVKVDDATSKVSILNDLGYTVTDNLVSDLIILVEGPKDRPVLEELMIKMGILEKSDIKIWPLGGDIMDQLDLSVFAEKYNIIALIDKDVKSKIIRKRFEYNCKEYSIPVHKLDKYAIENYFSIDALKKVYGSQIPEDISKIKPNVKLETQLGFNVKKKNREIIKEMSIEDIKGTDLYEWLEKIPEHCSSNIIGIE